MTPKSASVRSFGPELLRKSEINLAKAVAAKRFERRTEARAKFGEFIQWAAEHPHPQWVFRGQGQPWTLLPAVGRIATRYSPIREVQLLDEFKRLARQHIQNSHALSEWDWMFIAQHHGLPTRLLDWSTNPLVACYFACEESPNGKRAGLITAISPREVGFLSPDQRDSGPLSIAKTGFIFPTAVASRIVAQRGLFSVHSAPTVAWRARGKREFFQVPAHLKREIRRLLLGLGVDAQFLMADLDGLTATLKWRYDNAIPFQ